MGVAPREDLKSSLIGVLGVVVDVHGGTGEVLIAHC